MTSIFAGLDWSGRAAPDSKTPDIFVTCFVGVEEVEVLAERFQSLRAQLALRNAELHGHHLTPEAIAATLQIGLELEMRVGAQSLDKKAALRAGNLSTSDELHAQQALCLWPLFLTAGPVTRLVYDTDIEGKARQVAFETELKRASTQIFPGHKWKAKAFPSHKSDLIQLADVVAYALARQVKGQKVEPEIVQHLRAIRASSQNVFLESGE